jgi:hypothetical protein
MDGLTFVKGVGGLIAAGLLVLALFLVFGKNGLLSSARERTLRERQQRSFSEMQRQQNLRSPFERANVP